MKALSICQPWAQLIVCGVKGVETRGWRTGYRGRLAIHASKTFTTTHYDLCARAPLASALDALGYTFAGDLPRGKLLGCVDLVDCQPVEDLAALLPKTELALGDFRPGRWAWLLANPRPLAVPVSCVGTLGLFEIPEEIFEGFP